MATKKRKRPQDDIKEQKDDSIKAINEYIITNAVASHPDRIEEKFDAKLMRERFVEYVKVSSDNDMPIARENMCSYLGITNQFFNQVLHNQAYRGQHQDLVNLFTWINQVLSAALEMYMAKSIIQPVNGIWWQKNSYGYRDQIDVVRTEIRDTDLRSMTKADLQKKYAEISNRLLEEKHLVISKEEFDTAVKREKYRQQDWTIEEKREHERVKSKRLTDRKKKALAENEKKLAESGAERKDFFDAKFKEQKKQKEKNGNT